MDTFKKKIDNIISLEQPLQPEVDIKAVVEHLSTSIQTIQDRRKQMETKHSNHRPEGLDTERTKQRHSKVLEESHTYGSIGSLKDTVNLILQ